MRLKLYSAAKQRELDQRDWKKVGKAEGIIEGRIEGEISKSADLVQRVMANSNVSFEQACEMLSLTEKEIAVISEYMALHSS
ncbi:MAG: hypothetical protein IJM63_05350 [Solobacterium sp.]|nr:hypothetical protein [Solobacterium sp.]